MAHRPRLAADAGPAKAGHYVLCTLEDALGAGLASEHGSNLRGLLELTLTRTSPSGAHSEGVERRQSRDATNERRRKTPLGRTGMTDRLDTNVLFQPTPERQQEQRDENADREREQNDRENSQNVSDRWLGESPSQGPEGCQGRPNSTVRTFSSPFSSVTTTVTASL